MLITCPKVTCVSLMSSGRIVALRLKQIAMSRVSDVEVSGRPETSILFAPGGSSNQDQEWSSR